MYLIAGLGNPGKEYESTRHNIGFKTIDMISRSLKVPVTGSRCQAMIGQGEVDDHKIILAKPQTFMNLSGDSISELARWHKIENDHIIVIHDDLDLEVGRIKIRQKGNSAGHKGIESVINRLGTAEFIRIRIGIGREGLGDNSDYVLAKVPKDQQELIDKAVIDAADAAVAVIRSGIEAAMNLYN